MKITPRALRNIVNRQRETGSAAALPRPGPPKVLTDADESVLARLSEELDGNYTWDEITKRFNEETGKDVCKLTVFRFCNSRGWHEVYDKECTASPPCSQALSHDTKRFEVRARVLDMYNTVVLHRDM